MAVEKPNILLIIADDLGIDTFHINDATDVATVQLTGTGSYPLPNFSRLVREGIHFTRAWAHPICAPTRATLFTGLNPWRTTIGDAAAIPEPILPLELPTNDAPTIRTLADVVSAADYQCAIFGKWDLGSDPETTVPTARGWHRHEGILAGGLRFIPENPPNKTLYEQIIQQDVRYVSWEKVVGDAHLGLVRQNITPEARTYQYATADQVFSARDWIRHVQGRPWWVTLSLFTPHDPFHVPPAGTYTIRFKDPDNPTIQEMFVAMTESMDYYLGQLFNDPDPEIQNQLKNTVIIFMGDNGSQDELDNISGDDKSSVYIGGTHVPMIIADGGSMFGNAPCYLDADRMSSEKHSMVHVVDIFQTIINIVGGTAPAGYTTDSISMLPYLRNTDGDARFANWQKRPYNFGQFFAPPEIPGRYQRLGERATISDGTYKLNYQNGTYEFSELQFDPATDITTEIVTNNFQHPKAHELWQALTTPGSPFYAEIDSKGKKFPPLPEVTVPLYQYIRLVAVSEVNGNPWTSVANITLLDATGAALVNHAHWIVTADSQETIGENGLARNAVDGKPNTIWHTEWYYNSPSHPHELTIDLGSPYQLTGFKYLPRQNAENGRIKKYQLFASQDKSNWVLLTEGEFPNSIEEQTVVFASMTVHQ
ncbi:MAG: sulfatase-like hydrolase/transferase [Chloroflexaceae bacterium]